MRRWSIREADAEQAIVADAEQAIVLIAAK
jgi:hypothetical protein